MKKIMLLFIFCIGLFFLLFGDGYAVSKKEDYDLQERCGKRAEEYFKRDYGSGDNGDEHYNYINHYNTKLNKCFMLVTIGSLEKKLIQEKLIDINENKEYGDIIYKLDNKQMHCMFLDKVCRSKDEWDVLVKPYMEE